MYAKTTVVLLIAKGLCVEEHVEVKETFDMCLPGLSNQQQPGSGIVTKNFLVSSDEGYIRLRLSPPGLQTVKRGCEWNRHKADVFFIGYP